MWKLKNRSRTSIAPASVIMLASLPGSAKRNAPDASGSAGGVSTYRDRTSVTTCKNGLYSLFCHTASANAAPFLVTRNISRREVNGLGQNMSPSRQYTTSNELSPNGSESAE